MKLEPVPGINLGLAQKEQSADQPATIFEAYEANDEGEYIKDETSMYLGNNRGRNEFQSYPVLRYLDRQTVGAEFTTKDIMDDPEVGFTKDQFQNARDNPIVNFLLKSYEINDHRRIHDLTLLKQSTGLSPPEDEILLVFESKELHTPEQSDDCSGLTILRRNI